MGSLTPSDIVWLAAILIIAGAFTGMLAGLFGVGGGTVVVPVLHEVFALVNVPDAVRMPLCVGTSLAVIVPTSISSFMGHYRKSTVDLVVLRNWILPIVLGVGAGVAAAAIAKPFVFKAVFIFVCLFLSVRLIIGKDRWRIGDALPGPFGMGAYGVLIGASSSLMGIGGGLVANVVLSLYGRPIHSVIATSSGVGLIVSIPGALGYVIAGWGHAGLPPLSLGYVSVIGFALLTPLSLLTVRFGVGLAHNLKKRQLEGALSMYLFAVSLRFATSMI